MNWRKFRKPQDFDERMATLTDRALHPFNCAYVVAKAVRSVKNDGFGIVFPDPGFRYFPTCHEKKAISPRNKSSAKAYDVRLYSYDNAGRESVPFDVIGGHPAYFTTDEYGMPLYVGVTAEGEARCVPYEDRETIHCNIEKLPTRCVCAEDGAESTLAYHLNDISVVNYVPICCTAKNQNVIASHIGRPLIVA